MSGGKNWALPSGAREQIGPKGRKESQKDAAYFISFNRVDDFTSHMKMKEIGPYPGKLCFNILQCLPPNCYNKNFKKP